jgi:EpsI family protein
VPSGAFLVPALQAFTAHFAVAGLHVLGIPVYSTGALIEIPAGTFAVAEACAGLRFLIAAVAFGVFFAILTYRSPWRRGVFIALCVIVPVIANGFRALGLIAAAEWVGSPTAALADHVLYGWIFFSVVLLALIVIGRWFSDGGRPDFETVTSASSSRLPARKILTAGLACAIAALVAPVLALAANGSETHTAPDAPPRVSAPWQEVATQGGWRPVVLSPAHAFQNTYSNGPLHLDRYVAVYDWPVRERRFIRSDNRDADEDVWQFNSAGFTRLRVHGEILPVRLSTWVRGSRTRLVWSFYVVGGRIIATQLGAKWNQLLALVSRRKCAGAYIALSTEGITVAVGNTAVTKFLQANEPIPAYLCRYRVSPKSS